MPDPRILAYHNAAAAYERTKTTLQHLIARVQRAAKRLDELQTSPKISPRGTRLAPLQEGDWPSREEINTTLKAVQDAEQALCDARSALPPEEEGRLSS
jgi:hypothetical protein